MSLSKNRRLSRRPARYQPWTPPAPKPPLPLAVRLLIGAVVMIFIYAIFGWF